VTAGAGACQACGAPCEAVPAAGTVAATQLARQLVARARESQLTGDLPAALACAHQALELRPQCSSIHALLGHLYERSGDSVAARTHFEQALQVTATVECPVLPDTADALRGGGSGWRVWVLVGCILVSGLAALYSCWPHANAGGQAAIFYRTAARPALPSTPDWKWEDAQRPSALPAPILTPAQPPVPLSTAVPPLPAPPVVSVVSVVAPAPPPAPTPAPAVPPAVLGPSARSTLAPSPLAPLLDKADQAYFSGQYEQAISLYEAILTQEEHPHPRLHQDLAWCYQHVENSARAAEHLDLAVAGYQSLLDEEPQNATAHQNLHSCQVALRALKSSRTLTSEPLMPER
jgi:hypothetical protein